MKRVLNNVKDEARRRSVSPQLKDAESPRGSTSPDSPRSEEVELHQLVDVSDANCSASLHLLEGKDNQKKEMGNVERRSLDRPGPEIDGLAEKISSGKRSVRLVYVTIAMTGVIMTIIRIIIIVNIIFIIDTFFFLLVMPHSGPWTDLRFS